MTTTIIDGKKIARKIRQEVKQNVDRLKEQTGKTPGLAVILVGEDPASEIYVRNKGKQTTEAGMASFEFKMPNSITQQELIEKIHELNADQHVHGILVQLPLPEGINENAVIDAISPQKDVDGFHVQNSGLLATGQKAMVPCTPLGCIIMLKDTLDDLSGLNAVVIGRSNIVGKPMASLLLNENCTVTIVHSRTKNIEEICRNADIIVAAVGKPQMIKGHWIKKGATIIDVGINRIKVNGKNKLVGDIDFNEAIEIAGAITPVPGGVGPMTIACLLKNTVTCFCNINNIQL